MAYSEYEGPNTSHFTSSKPWWQQGSGNKGLSWHGHGHGFTFHIEALTSSKSSFFSFSLLVFCLKSVSPVLVASLSPGWNKTNIHFWKLHGKDQLFLMLESLTCSQHAGSSPALEESAHVGSMKCTFPLTENTGYLLTSLFVRGKSQKEP